MSLSTGEQLMSSIGAGVEVLNRLRTTYSPYADYGKFSHLILPSSKTPALSDCLSSLQFCHSLKVGMLAVETTQ